MLESPGETMTSARPDRVRVAALKAAGAGVAAGLAYASIALALLSPLPVQIAYGRGGRKAGLLAALVAVLAAAAAQSARYIGDGSFSLAVLAASAIPPLVIFAALALVNARFWEGVPATYRALAVSTACALAVIPAILTLERDGSFVAYLSEQLGAMLEPLRKQAESLGAQAGEGGYDAAALMASLDPKAMAQVAMKTFESCYAAIIALMIGGGAWLGNRLSGPGSRGRAIAPALSDYKVPYPLLWCFLGGWAALLAVLLLEASGTLAVAPALRAAAWNCAILFSLPYAAQGIGIASSLSRKWNMPRLTRIALVATAVLALFTPTAGLVLILGLLLLGVTEVWIPYRNPKGVGA